MINSNVGLNADATVHNKEDTNSILEAQLGAEWTREIRSNGLLFFRFAFEAQEWNNVSGFPVLGGDASVGFFGFALAAGIHR